MANQDTQDFYQGKSMTFICFFASPMKKSEGLQGRTQDLRRGGGCREEGRGCREWGGGPRSTKEANNPNKHATELKSRTCAHQGSIFRP